MKITIEHAGYRMVIEPEHIETFELHTPIAGGQPRLELNAELVEVPLWEQVSDGDQ